jgi:hypothetical protein
MIPAILARMAVQAVLPAIGQRVRPELIATVTEKLATQVNTDPIIQNATNSEPALRSRVVVGSLSVVAGAVGVILVEVTTYDFPNYQWDVLGPALVTLWGGGYALYGRLWAGLKPLRSGAK